MKTSTIFVFVVLMSVAIGVECLRCYECDEKSNAECLKTQKSVECLAHRSRTCVKVAMKDGRVIKVCELNNY